MFSMLMYSFYESLKEILESNTCVFLDRGKLTSLAVKPVTQADDDSHHPGLFQTLPLVDCQVFTNKAMWHSLILEGARARTGLCVDVGSGVMI